MKEKLYFIGTLPEPTGGVTIFNKRKVGLLQKDYDVCVIEPSLNTLWKIIYTFIFKKDLIYISTFNFLIVFIAVICKTKGFYFIDHNTSRHIENFGGFKKSICLKFLKNAKEIVLVSSHLKDNYKKINFYNNLNFKIEQAFIPPNVEEADNIINSIYPDKLKSNLFKKKLVIASASKTNLDISGQDIYSLELTLKAYDRLANEHPDLIFVMAIAEFSNDEFGLKIRKMSENLQSKYNNFILLTNNTPIWPLFKFGLVFLRITTTDGDSVSLKESLFFDCPVLATDVVSRPAGTKLFNLKNDDLFNAIENLIEESK